MIVAPPDQLLLQYVGTTLSAVLLGSDGEPATGLTATVTVARADGTVLHTAQSATHAGSGVYTYTLDAADVATLDILTATWTVSAATRAVTTHAVVGAAYFNRAELVGSEQDRAPSLGTAQYDTIHAEVAAECEQLTRISFVPRYRRVRVNGSGRCWLDLPDHPVRAVRSVRVYSSATSYEDFDQTALDAIACLSFGTIERQDGGWFTAGTGNILIGYEYGHDQPPADLKRAAIRRARTRAYSAKSGIPDRALSYTAENGGTYRLATPGVNHTGDPDVDAVYQRYAESQQRPLVG